VRPTCSVVAVAAPQRTLAAARALAAAHRTSMSTSIFGAISHGPS
jgi:hypothetical protein